MTAAPLTWLVIQATAADCATAAGPGETACGGAARSETDGRTARGADADAVKTPASSKPARATTVTATIASPRRRRKAGWRSRRDAHSSTVVSRTRPHEGSGRTWRTGRTGRTTGTRPGTGRWFSVVTSATPFVLCGATMGRRRVADHTKAALIRQYC